MFFQKKSFLLFASIGAFIALLAFGQTLTWYLVYSWSASGDLCQSIWDRILDLFGHDEFKVNVYGTFIFHLTVYTVLITPFTIVDLTGKPAFLLKYKVQEPKGEYPVPWTIVSRAFKQAIINEIYQVPIALFVGTMHNELKLGGHQLEKLPQFHSVVLEVIISLLIFDIGYYYIHRAYHTFPVLYKYVHSYHHQWRSPIAISCLDIHPLENIMIGFVGSLVPALMGSHTVTLWLLLTCIHILDTSYHSGYHLPFLPSPEAHDYHHLNPKQNYGYLGFNFWDTLHGTDSEFRKTKKFQRNSVLFSLVPIKVLYPDEPKNTS